MLCYDANKCGSSSCNLLEDCVQLYVVILRKIFKVNNYFYRYLIYWARLFHATIHHDPPPSTATHHHPPPPTTTHRHPPPPTTTHHHPPPPTTTHHHPPPPTTTRIYYIPYRLIFFLLYDVNNRNYDTKTLRGV